MANELGMTVDRAAFDKAMEEFKAMSVEAREEHLRKQAAGGEGLVPKLDALATDALEKLKVPGWSLGLSHLHEEVNALAY